MNTDTAALIGTGALGSAVARRLAVLKRGVRAWNRTPGGLAPLAGPLFTACETPAVAAEEVDVVLTVVSDIRALEAVLFGPGGVALDERRTGRRAPVIVDHGTHAPAALADVARRVRDRGLRFVEAPVTGSVHAVSSGTLDFLAGGDAADVESVRPFLETWGRRVYHLGAAGAGNNAKLALNLLVGVMALGLGEAAAMLKASGQDFAQFLDVLEGSGLHSPLYQRLGQRYTAGDFAPRFSLANLGKDLALARDHARQLGCAAPVAGLAAGCASAVDPATQLLDYAVLLRVACDGA